MPSAKFFRYWPTPRPDEQASGVGLRLCVSFGLRRIAERNSHLSMDDAAARGAEPVFGGRQRIRHDPPKCDRDVEETSQGDAKTGSFLLAGLWLVRASR